MATYTIVTEYSTTTYPVSSITGMCKHLQAAGVAYTVCKNGREVARHTPKV